MIDNWFTNKCMTLVGSNGRALAGDALKAAELALQEAKMANHTIWRDRNGNFYHKERRLFAPIFPLKDNNGNQVRICGRLVTIKAKFCSIIGEKNARNIRPTAAGAMIMMRSSSLKRLRRYNQQWQLP
jgi:hypothetical protein